MDAEEWHGLAVDLNTVLEKRNAEIASLRAERANATTWATQIMDNGLAIIKRQEIELEVARRDAEEIGRLTAALKPFAQLAEAIECTSDHTYDDGDHWEIEIGALRQARAALACRPQGDTVDDAPSCGSENDYRNACRPQSSKVPTMKPERCPRCNSPSPERHPAMQFEGEVEICPHPFHGAQPSRPASDQG